MKLTVNQSNLLSNIGTVFTDQTKVVTELVQNSRRAGATSVAIDFEGDEGFVSKISIRDNGHGIECFSKLFILAESGWDAGVQESEQPYGMGFFATLSCAKTVKVRSLHQIITIDSEQALAGADIGEPVACEFYPGTEIVLDGVKIDRNTFNSFLSMAFTFSSIEILINGVAARRGLALCNTNQDKVIDTPFGQLVMNEWFISATSVIVQDMRIGSFNSLTSWREPNCLFANARILARMPDRDSILNKASIEAEFNTWLATMYQEKLIALRSEISNDVLFLEKHYCAVLTYCPAMLNEIDWLPASAFYNAAYPIRGGSTNTNDKGFTFDVHRSALESGKVLIASKIACLYSDEQVISHFLYRSNALVLSFDSSEHLPQDHWARPFIRNFSENDFTVTFKESRSPITIEVAHISRFTVSACDEIEIRYTLTGQTVSIQDDCIYFGDSEAVIQYPSGASAGCAVVGNFCMQSLLLQMSSYEDENDTLLDELLDNDTRSAELQFKAATGVDAGVILSDLIGNLPESIRTALAGKDFLARMVDGRMQFVRSELAA